MTNSRIIIYAVRPFHRKDEYPKVNQFAAADLSKVEDKWKHDLAFLKDVEN
jgi:hypothetical protein